MKTLVKPGWSLQVDRGPDWLIIKILPNGHSYYESPDMADKLWKVLSDHFTYRVILDMSEVNVFPSHLMGQLVMLQKRVMQHGGALRLYRLQPSCRESLRLTRLDTVLPSYDRLEDAVLANSVKPR